MHRLRGDVRRLRRRDLMGLAAAVNMLPAASRAQGEGAKVGLVISGLVTVRQEAVVNGLRSVGLGDAQIEMVVRVTEGNPARLVPSIREVLDRKVSVVVVGGPASVRAAMAQTKSVAIVAVDLESDPVADGYVQSIARPGGNVTGIFLDMPGFAGKWLEFLRECLPGLSRVALLWDPGTGRLQVDALVKSAGQFGIRTELLEVRTPADFAGVFAVAKDRGAEAVVMLSAPLIANNAKELADLSQRHRLPGITLFAEYARAGGLLSYGPSLTAAFRQAGAMGGKVVKGISPAIMPIERPATFELVVNVRAAAALGLKIPATLAGRADEIID